MNRHLNNEGRKCKTSRVKGKDISGRGRVKEGEYG
jgi:hypothetical protein